MISTVALLLVLQGCESSNSDTKCNTEPKTEISSEIKSFVKTLSGDEIISTVIKKSASSSEDSSVNSKNKIYRKTVTQNCLDGGTREITSDINLKNMDNPQEITSKEFKVNIITNQCIENGIKSNGSMQIWVQEKDKYLSTTTIKFKSDSTFEDLGTDKSYTLFKESNVTIDEISYTEEIVTESIKGTSSTGDKFQSINLITHETFTENSESSHEISGEIVHKGIKYRVDKGYDSSRTPMLFDNYKNLISGTAKYFNEKNHHITVEIVNKNKVKISVDIDNDGRTDEEETVVI
jgi:hypothetical protein